MNAITVVPLLQGPASRVTFPPRRFIPRKPWKRRPPTPRRCGRRRCELLLVDTPVVGQLDHCGYRFSP